MALKPVYTQAGGFETACLYSGEVAPTLTGARGAFAVGSDVMFASGAGRLNAIITHQSFFVLSGVFGSIYDAAAPVSGGPIAASGHIPLGSAPNGALAGVSGALVTAGQVISLNVPYNSGLCYNSRSGQAGVTFVFTPESARTNI